MNFSNYKLPIIILAIILFGGAGFLFFMGSKYQKQKPTAPVVSVLTSIPATPTPLPMDSVSADPELQNADVQIEAALKEAEDDLNAINKIDASDETTAGL